MPANGYSEAAIKTLWDILVPFSDYAFNKAHTAGYGLVSYWTAYLKANYPAEYMAALLTSVARRQGQVGALPQRVPPDGHQGAAARRQRVRRRLHAARHRHPVRPLRDPQRRRERRRVDRGDPRGEGPVHRLLRLPAQGRPGRLQQEDRRVADQGRRVRLARPHPPRPAHRARRGHRLVHGDQAQRGASASSTCSARGDERRAGATVDRRLPAIPIGEWDKSVLLAYEREMLGLYVSDHPLFGVEHVLAGGRRLLDRRADRLRRARRRLASSPSAAWSAGCSAR